MKQSNRLLFLSLFAVIACLPLAAQDWSGYRTGEQYPGYIILNDGTKLEGYIEAQPRCMAAEAFADNSNQNRVIFYSEYRNKKTRSIYKPDQVKEYKIAEKVYRSIYYSGGLISKALRFVLLTADGPLARFTWYTDNGTVNRPDIQEIHLLQKGDDKPVDLSLFALNFSKKMSELVYDCGELSDKVAAKAKGYSFLQLDAIVDEYNRCYAESHSAE